MVMPRLVPCLDVRDGRVVKGVRFQGLRDAGDPVERASLYADSGADELCLLDVSATVEGRANQRGTVAAVRRAIGIPLLVGGGVRTLDDARALLDAGADKVAVNTAATKNPEIIREISDTYGSQAMVLSIEAKSQPQGGWEAMTDNGRNHTGRDVVKWAVEAAELGAGEILITSIDRDGTMKGMDINLIKAVASEVDIPVIASGGVASSAHVSQAVEAGATAVSLAKALHTDHLSFAGLRDELSQTGMPVRNQYTGDAA